MGLLDNLSANDIGLLQMGLGMMANSRGRSFGESFGAGGFQGLQAMQQAKQQEQMAAYQKAQEERYQALAERERNQLEREKNYQAAIKGLSPDANENDVNRLLMEYDPESYLKTRMTKTRDGVPTGFIANSDGSIAPMPISGGGNYMDYQVQLANQKAQLPSYGEAERLRMQYEKHNQDIAEAQAKAFERGKLDIPAQQMDAQLGNFETLANIDRGLGLIEANPNGLGLKNFAPDFVTQRISPENTDIRAVISGIGGNKFHDLSGAAISVSEAKRLQPYIPTDTDSPATAKEKLKNLKAEILYENDARAKMFSQQNGYKRNIPSYSAQDSFDQSNPKPGQVLDGHVYKGGDPSKESSWSKL